MSEGESNKESFDEAEKQARLLRVAAAERVRIQRDWERLTGQIEDLASWELSALASQVRRVIVHLLKLQFSPATDPQSGWAEAIRIDRALIANRVGRSLGVQPRLAEMIEGERRRAARRAADEVGFFQEFEAAERILQHGGDYTDDQILGDWFPEFPL